MLRQDESKQEMTFPTLAALAQDFSRIVLPAPSSQLGLILVIGKSTNNDLTATNNKRSSSFRHPAQRRLKKIDSADGRLKRW